MQEMSTGYLMSRQKQITKRLHPTIVAILHRYAPINVKPYPQYGEGGDIVGI